MRKYKKQRSKKEIASTVIFVIALIVFLYALIRLGIILWEYEKGQWSYDKLEEFTNDTDKGDGEELTAKPEDFSVDFDALKEINADVVGWIRFENMDISYPIVKGGDNEYYLTHSFDGQEIKCGSIFMEAENSADFSDENTFIYGHNMKDKSMFAKLNQFQDEQIFRENPEFLIYTEEGIYRYSIFSCYVADVSWDSFTYQFADNAAYGKWLETVKGRSIYDTGVTPSEEKNTVTLMTCTAAGDNYRFLVHGTLTEVIEEQAEAEE